MMICHISVWLFPSPPLIRVAQRLTSVLIYEKKLEKGLCSCQQRLSHTILSDLALALIDGTVFEIVQGLLEIQHLTEKNLYNQRLKLHAEHRALKQDLIRKHKEAQQACKTHNMSVLKAAQQKEVESLENRIKEEQRMMDEKIVIELDQKVIDQQSTLEKAGVSGFYITTNPQVTRTICHFPSDLFMIMKRPIFFLFLYAINPFAAEPFHASVLS
uniref:Uncharacterized protein n=1 Tax=Leptobrachium leishanense TaxID=445787 RepID=A0A8C5LSN2_9ANUR